MAEQLTNDKWQRAKEIFEAALEQPPESRSAFLVQACQGDTQLKVEVENLLAGDARMDSSFLNSLATSSVFTARPIPQPIFREHQIISQRFEILRFIGGGGMGEVYEAKDLDLQERVALKVIRPDQSSDPAMRRRFRHELQLARRVTHPNVCRLHHLESCTLPAGDSGEPGSAITYITMELLEGETLAERLKRQGRMAESEAGPLVCQIAEGLAAAHEAGVIHRDLKPGNIILVSSSGKARAVITDFGLARVAAGMRLLSEGDSMGPVSSSGLLVGTLQYMAPEQLEGGKITPATDIYALGLIMYEMVTGGRPYADDAPLAGAFQRLKQLPPSPRVHCPELDPTWESVILRCLEIDPAHRPNSAREVVSDLEDGPVRALQYETKTRTSSKIARLWRLSPFWFGALLLAIAGVALWLLWRRNGQAPLAPFESFVQLTTDSGLTWCPSLSADGKLLAYSSDREGPGNLEIWVQYVSGGRPVRVTHSNANNVSPSLSPDGSRIVYRSERTGGGIYISSTYGGDERLLAKFGRDPKFSPDGTQVLYWTGEEGTSSRPTGRTYLIPAQGGDSHLVQPDFADSRYPVWSPDGRNILFLGTRDASLSPSTASDWWVVPQGVGQAVPTGALGLIRQQGLRLHGCPPFWVKGHVIFSALLADSTNLWEIALSGSDWQAQGPVIRMTSGTAEEASPHMSRDGRFVFSKTEAKSNIYQLSLTDTAPSGHPILRTITSDSAWDIEPTVSSDGGKLAFIKWSRGSQSVWLRNLNGNSEAALALSSAAHPTIDPGGDKIAYSTGTAEQSSIWVAPLGGATPEKICEACGDVLSWSPDNGHILYRFGEPSRVGIVSLTSGQKSVFLEKNGYSIDQAQISPDGRWVVFCLRIDGDHSKILVAPIRGDSAMKEDQWIGLTEGASWDDKPRWSTDGRSLFYLSNRDGFVCIWALRVDSSTSRKARPVAVKHFHMTRQSLMYLSEDAMNLSVGEGRLVFDLVETSGNIWMVDKFVKN